MKKFVFLFFCFFCHLLIAQRKQTTDSVLIRKIELFNNKGTGFLYRNADSARFYLLKSYQLSDKYTLSDNLDGLDNKLGVLSLLINSDGFHFDLKNLKKDIEVMDSIMVNDPNIDSLPFKQDYQKFLNTNKGNYHFKLNNLPKAKRYFKELLDTYYNGSNDLSSFDIVTKITIQEYLASIARQEGKNNLAKEYYSKIISEIDNSKVQNWQSHLVGAKYRLSQVLMIEKKYDVAKEILLESLEFLETLKDKAKAANTIKATYQVLIKNYIEQDSIEIALSYIERSKMLYNKEDPLLNKLEVLTGDVHTKNKEFGKDVAEAFSRLGSLCMAKENPQKALEFYQQSLIQLVPDFENTEINKNPDPKKVLSKLELVKILREKLEALQLSYKKNNRLTDLTIALATSHDIIKALDLLKPEFESKVDKQFLISEMYPAFHSMVAVAYELYKTTGESGYITDAFYFTEKSKSVLLLEAARNTQASSYGGVPEKIIDKEQQFRANIIHLEKKFFNQKSNMVVFDSLFKLKNNYYNFISDIEREYPKYYDLKYNAAVISLEETATEVVKNKALLSYFATDTEVFLITVENDKKSFYKIVLTAEDRTRIKQFYKMLSVVNIQDIPKIREDGYKIYQQLLKEPLQTLKSKELFIIPDDVLNYLPFEALSTSDNSGDYLIKEYQISYANSATLLREQQSKTKAKENKLVAYAPNFGETGTEIQENRANFGPLLFNTKEVHNITKYFNGKAVIGNNASVASFSENSQAYNMLHFATHAAANDENPDYSYLAFTPNDIDTTNLLYVKDLYGYTINADLVALSACQTGLGKLQKGEGMLSLARGFSYAGAKSLVTTLWKINDQTTSELMQEFYKNLDASLPKDKALRKAKLSYLNSVDDELLTHPYYWSGFMISGDTSSLTSEDKNIWWVLLVLIPLIALIYKKRKSNNKK